MADTQRRRPAGTSGARRLSSAVRPSARRTRSIAVRNAASIRATGPVTGSSSPSPRVAPGARPWRRSQARTAAAAPRGGPKRDWIRRGRRKWRNLAEPGVETSLASRSRPRGRAERSATVMCSVADLASGPVTRAPGGIRPPGRPGSHSQPGGRRGPARAGCPPRRGWRPARPAAPISAAAARAAVPAGHVRRFRIPCPPVAARRIEGMLGEPGPVAGDPTFRARPARAGHAAPGRSGHRSRSATRPLSCGSRARPGARDTGKLSTAGAPSRPGSPAPGIRGGTPSDDRPARGLHAPAQRFRPGMPVLLAPARPSGTTRNGAGPVRPAADEPDRPSTLHRSAGQEANSRPPSSAGHGGSGRQRGGSSGPRRWRRRRRA